MENDLGNEPVFDDRAGDNVALEVWAKLHSSGLDGPAWYFGRQQPQRAHLQEATLRRGHLRRKRHGHAPALRGGEALQP